MTNTTITIDRSETLQVPLNFTTKITLDHHPTTRDGIGDPAHLLIRELTRADVGINTSFIKNLSGRFGANSINIRKRRFDAFLIGDLNSE